MTTSKLLAILALVFAILSFVVTGFPLLAIAVILLALAHIV
jgi:hypothetical protein